MAKKSNFWQENKLDLIPVIVCAGCVALLAGFYQYNQSATERKHNEKVKEIKAAMDSVNQAKDTIALSAIKQNQK